jgi:two-component system nitrogen regulation sensor histidine kinase NtrY
MSYNADNLLESSALTLQKKLNDREAFVEDFLKDQTKFKKLEHLSQNEKEALQLIKEISQDKEITFCTYRNSKLNFWSSIQIVPDSASAYQSGASFIQENKVSYEAIKKTEGSFTVLFFIPVKTAYAYQNQYINNNFSAQLLDNDNIDFAQPNKKPAPDSFIFGDDKTW